MKEAVLFWPLDCSVFLWLDIQLIAVNLVVRVTINFSFSLICHPLCDSTLHIKPLLLICALTTFFDRNCGCNLSETFTKFLQNFCPNPNQYPESHPSPILFLNPKPTGKWSLFLHFWFRRTLITPTLKKQFSPLSPQSCIFIQRERLVVWFGISVKKYVQINHPTSKILKF